MELVKDIEIRIKKEDVFLKRGSYIYVGSAFGAGGLSSRIHRHLRRDKKQHWHIDQVTSKDICQFHGVVAFTNEKIECEIANSLSKNGEITPIKDFGNSDCRENCISHFLYLG